MAREYVDTVKADKRVSNVTFVGQAPGIVLPFPSWDNPIKQCELLSFGFDQDSSNTADERWTLNSISIEIDDDSPIYWAQIPEDRKAIDSLLQAKTKYPK